MENFWIYFQNTLPSWAFGIQPFSICRDFCLFHFDCAIYFTLAQLKRLIVFGEGVARCRPEMSQCYRFTKDNNQIFFVASDVQVLSESKLNERGTKRITFSLVPKQLNLFSVSFSTGSHFIMKFCGRIHSVRSRFLDTIFFLQWLCRDMISTGRNFHIKFEVFASFDFPFHFGLPVWHRIFNSFCYLPNQYFSKNFHQPNVQSYNLIMCNACAENINV